MEQGYRHVQNPKRGEPHNTHPLPVPGERKNDNNNACGNLKNSQTIELLPEGSVSTENIKREDADEYRACNTQRSWRPIEQPLANAAELPVPVLSGDGFPGCVPDRGGLVEVGIVGHVATN